jgi:hypothetical protein
MTLVCAATVSCINQQCIAGSGTSCKLVLQRLTAAGVSSWSSEGLIDCPGLSLAATVSAKHTHGASFATRPTLLGLAISAPSLKDLLVSANIQSPSCLLTCARCVSWPLAGASPHPAQQHEGPKEGPAKISMCEAASHD